MKHKVSIIVGASMLVLAFMVVSQQMSNTPTLSGNLMKPNTAVDGAKTCKEGFIDECGDPAPGIRTLQYANCLTTPVACKEIPVTQSSSSVGPRWGYQNCKDTCKPQGSTGNYADEMSCLDAFKKQCAAPSSTGQVMPK